MAEAIRIKMMDKDVEFDLTGNTITKSSIKSALLLGDADVSLSYEVDGRRKFCQSQIVPEPCFLLPDGWPAIQFFVDSDKAPSRPATPKKNSFLVPREPAPTSEAFIQWMFYLHNHLGKATTICVHPRFFVTFRHGTHQQFNLGDTMKMYRAEKEVDEQIGIDVCVAKINESLDFVLLKSEFDVVERGPSIAQARDSEPFTLAGFGNDQGHISYLLGAIHYVRDYYFGNGVRQMGPFILGTSRSSRGDSGGGIWGSRGLIGMNFGCTMMPLQLHHEAISEAATFSAKNIISPAFWFKHAYMEELAKEHKEEKVASPPRKKAVVMTEIEGIGILYGRET